MSWTAPMTATAHTAFPAASFNTYVRDNLLETEPGEAGSSVANGSIPVKSATNAISYRTPDIAEIMTSQTTTSTSYTNLSTAGPTVSATVGTTALVFWHASLSNNSGSENSLMSVQATLGGGGTTAASDNYAISNKDTSVGESMFGTYYLFTGLTPGVYSFQAKYRVTGSTGTFRRRRIGVIPL